MSDGPGDGSEPPLVGAGLRQALLDGEGSDPSAEDAPVEPPLLAENLGPAVIAFVEPGRVPTIGGVVLRIEGAGFVPGARVRLGAAVVDAAVESGGKLRLVSPAHPEGAVDVEVLLPDGRSAVLPGGLRFEGPPVIDAVEPPRGPAAGRRVTLVGRGFRPETRVAVGAGVARVVTLVDEGHLVVDLPPWPAGGPVTLRVENPDGQTGHAEFVHDRPPPPRVDSIEPDSATAGAAVRVLVRGEHFDALAVVTFGASVAEVLSRGPGLLEVAAPALERAASLAVTVENPDGSAATAPRPFRYEAVAPAVPALAIVSVVPDRGPTVGGTRVVVRGAGFRPDTRVLVGGAPPACQRYLDDGGIEIVTCPARSAATQDVVALDDRGQALADHGFSYEPSPPPKIHAARPSRLSAKGGETLRVVGSAFAMGARVTIGGYAATTRFVSATDLEAVTPRGQPGAYVDVGVQNPDGQHDEQRRACMLV